MTLLRFTIATLCLVALTQAVCPATCTVNTDCLSDGQICCGGQCVLPAAFRANNTRLLAGAACDLTDVCGDLCAAGLICKSGTCQTEVAPGCQCSTTGACYGECVSTAAGSICHATGLPQGSPCTDANVECNADASCSYGVCGAPVTAAAGAVCDFYNQCDSGFFCQINSTITAADLKAMATGAPHIRDLTALVKGTCVAKIDAGASCSVPTLDKVPCFYQATAHTLDVNPCADGSVCKQDVNGTTGNAFVCVAGGQGGDPCMTDSDCNAVSYCDRTTGLCAQRCSQGQVGAACRVDDECLFGCYAGVCGVPGNPTVQIGGACGAHWQCIGAAVTCDNGTCVDHLNQACNASDVKSCGYGVCSTCAAAGDATNGTSTNDTDASAQGVCEARGNPCWRQIARLQFKYSADNLTETNGYEADLLCCQACNGLPFSTVGVASFSCGGLAPTLTLQDSTVCPTGPVTFDGCDAYLSPSLDYQGPGPVCTPCPDEYFEVSPCTASSDRICSPCTPKCDNYYNYPSYEHFESTAYEVQACTATSNRICMPCTPCNTSEYESATCSETQNRNCTACTVCGADQFESEPCLQATPIHGYYNRACMNCTVCGAGEVIVTACNATQDTVCGPAPASTTDASTTAPASTTDASSTINIPTITTAGTTTGIDVSTNAASTVTASSTGITTAVASTSLTGGSTSLQSTLSLPTSSSSASTISSFVIPTGANQLPTTNSGPVTTAATLAVSTSGNTYTIPTLSARKVMHDKKAFAAVSEIQQRGNAGVASEKMGEANGAIKLLSHPAVALVGVAAVLLSRF